MDVTNSEEYKRVLRREATKASFQKKKVKGTAKHSFLRIIGGDLRSRKIEFRLEAETRPMKDRTREAIFNLLGYSIEDTIAVDLFAGTGILAFESISRGAAFGVAIEKLSERSAEIKTNLQRIGLERSMRVFTGDTFRVCHNPTKLLENLAPLTADERETEDLSPPPWVIFCCPPYAMWNEQPQPLIELIERFMDACPPLSAIVIEFETATADQFDFSREGFKWDRRGYFPATIAIGEKQVIGP